jgi:hypothetical protein
MNQIGNIQNNSQDSITQVNKDTSIIKVPDESLILNIKHPEVKSIPETPVKFQQRGVSVRPKQKDFIPSAVDSVEFNLNTKQQIHGGMLQNTVVDDFLNPLHCSDQEWVVPQVKHEYEQISMQKNQVDSIVSGFEEDTPKNTLDIQAYSAVNDSTTGLIVSDTISFVKDSVETDYITSNGQEIIEEIKIEEKVFIQNIQKDILSGLLLLSVTVIGVIRMTNYKYIKEVFSALAFVQAARKMQKTINLRHQKTAFALNFLFLFNTSIFVYQFIAYYKIDTIIGQNLLLIPLVIGILMCFAFIKRLLYKFIGFVFDCQKDTNSYLFYGLINDKVFGILIAPIIIVIPYIETPVVPILFNIGIGGFIILYILQIFRGIGIILKNLTSLFYLFLYLCALEILPLIIIYHILIN